jgi:hypothetical protein
MSDEQFLARWSRRKQEAKAGHVESAPDVAEAHVSASSDRAAAEQVPAETELSDLPPDLLSIESIDATTDITAFLRQGIPQEVSRAALRRAWSADPAIRDHVGLAENAWDFNDPNAMAGFGPLDYSAEQIDTLVRRVFEGVVETAGSVSDPLAKATEAAARSAHAEAGSAQSADPVRVITDSRQFDAFAAAELPSDSAALEPQADNDEASFPRRTHGGALPR